MGKLWREWLWPALMIFILVLGILARAYAEVWKNGVGFR